MNRWYPLTSRAAAAGRGFTPRPTADTAWPRPLTPRACPEGSGCRAQPRRAAGPPPPVERPGEAPGDSPCRLLEAGGGTGYGGPRPGSGDSPQTRPGAGPGRRARRSAPTDAPPARPAGTPPESQPRRSAARSAARPARPPPLASRLDRETPPSLGAAALQDLPPAGRPHPLSKAVRALALAAIGLVGPLHRGPLLSVEKPSKCTLPPAEVKTAPRRRI